MVKEILRIRNYIDGANDTSFPNETNPIDITAYNFTANRMGSVSLSASFMYPEQIDDLWDGTQYVEFRGEKFFLDQVPTSSKDTSDMRYKYEADFYSERKILESVYFFDVVTEDTGNDKYQSNSPSVTFYGDINEFVNRLNYSLKYSNLEYTVVIDYGITSEAKQVSLENEFIMDALQQIYEIFGLPFYFVGRVIHVGYTENAIAVPFAYGYDRELLSITKTNADYKIVNRCTGTGSPDNIPYYYPNETDDRSAIEASGKKWITPSSTLMPPIYRESEGAERFYNAVNNTYPNGSGGYYTFENEYKGNNPKEQIVEFSDIKPTIKGVTNASGQRIDLFVDFAYDSDDNDDVDPETGEYLHPYFYAKLRKMDGEYGFNLFEHAIADNTKMTISMTSGNCAGCSFEIGVVESVVDGKQVFKNPVQVDENGDIVEGTYADKVKPENIQDVQQDTSTNSVWIALKKDIDTFGTILPSVNNNYKPTSGDSFVILYIDLPLAYVTAAEKRLEDNIIAYMLENNSSKFNFSVEFSKIYFAENPDTLALMNENSRLILEYNNKEYTLYISSFSYKVTDDSPLPTITVDLEDTITVRKGALETAIDSITGDLVSGGFGDIIAQGTKYFLRKDIDDETKGKLTSRKGFDVGRFSSLVSGGTFRLDAGNKSYIEVDRLYVRLKAYFETLEIKRVTHVGGEQLITPASMKCNEVEDKGTFYRCYFLQEQDGETINNEFAINDQAICKQFDPKSGSQVTNHYFWRLVVGTGVNYIDLSKEDCDTASDAPMAGDVIVQLGHRTDASRQNAIIQSAYSVDAPSIKFLQGINSYSLDGKDIISQGFDSTTRRAFMNVVGDMFFGNRDESSYMKYDPENGLEIKGKIITKGGEDLDTVLDQFSDIIDGAIETWFYDPVPTLDNEPAVNWTTDDDKKKHLGDLYYSGEGKAYRFQKEGDQYIWKEIVDSDITEALALAKKAQQTADAAAQSVTNLNNYVDGAFKDGVIDDAEAIAIEKYKNSVNETRQAVEGTYNKIYGNVYLEDPAKSNLKSAYDELSLSITALLDTIDNAIADMTTTDEEKEAVDMAYSNFSNMMQAYNEAIEEANEAIQNKLKSFTDEVGERVDGYEYLKKALENDTTIEGGLIATSLVSTGYKESGKFVIKSGINGIYDSGKLGGGISYWAGGNIIDREEYDDEASIPENAATAVIRMDGTGYLANGNISWDSEGRIYADPMSFIVGDKLIGDLLDMFSAIKDNTNKIIGISALYPMTVNGDIISTNDIIAKSTSEAIADAELPIASKTQLGLIKVGSGFEIAADGTLNNTGGGGLTEVYWDDIKGKPTTFAPSSHTHTVSQITDLVYNGKNTEIDNYDLNYAGRQIWLSDASMPIPGINKTNGGLIVIRQAYGLSTQLLSSGAQFYTRWKSSTSDWTEWREFAYKDSTIEAATKLNPGCKIWGQAFTGESDITGSLTNVSSITMTDNINIADDFGIYKGDNWVVATNSKGQLLLNATGDIINIGYRGTTYLAFYGGATVAETTGSKLGEWTTDGLCVGGSSPQAKLHVVGDGLFEGSVIINNYEFLYFKDSAGTNRSFAYLDSNNDLVIANGTASVGYTTYLGYGDGFYLRKYNSPSDKVVVMMANSNGDVGFGTSSPQAKIHVSGTGRFTGTLNTANILPISNNTYELGSSSYRYKRLYLGNVNSSWIGGKTSANINIDSEVSNANTSTYFPVIRFKSYTGRVFNLGSLQNTDDTTHTFGFYMFDGDRTANGTDAGFYMKGDGNMYGSGSIIMSGDVIAKSTSTAISDAELPIASASTLGLIKVGSGLTISNGVLSVSGGSGSGSNVYWGSPTDDMVPLYVDDSYYELSRKKHKHAVSTNGTGNAVTSISFNKDTGGMILSKGSTFSLSGHTHSQYLTSLSRSTSGSGNVVTNVTVSGGTITVAFGNVSGGSSDWDGGSISNTIEKGDGYFLRGTGGAGYRLYLDYSDAEAYVDSGKHFQWFSGTVKAMQVGNGYNYAETNWQEGSDMRKKNRLDNISNVLNNMVRVDIFRYTWKHIKDSKIYIGVGAQLIEDIFPDVVSYNKEYDTYGVDYSAVGCIAFQGVKELYALQKQTTNEIDVLKQRIALLEAENQNLWNLINEKEAA